MIEFQIPGTPVGRGHKKATDDQIAESYRRLGSCVAVASEFRMCGQSVHERLVRIGIINLVRVFKDEERLKLLDKYKTAADSGRLCELAAEMGRTKQYLCRQARALGLTLNKGRKGISRPYATGEEASARSRDAIAKHGHPKGMAGKKHNTKTKQTISASSSAMWAGMTQDEKDDFIMNRRLAMKSLPKGRVGASWKSGWREIGGVNKYYRSKWEANYARYLQWLKEHGQIKGWLHEPKTFWFDGIKRGCLSYLPDFWVHEKDGKEAYHEVKGWMDDRSKTKIRRMAKYHPEVKLIIIDSKGYAAIKNAVQELVPGWEP